MRNVVSGLFVSLDSVTEAPEQWQMDYFNEEMGAAMSDQLATEDLVLLGRVTYELWEPFWPTSNDEPYAGFINQTPKLVVSRTLDSVEWGKYDTIRLLKGDLAKEVARLKQQPGKNISVHGSPTLVRSLLQLNLLDQLTLIIHPILVGKGKRLFEEGGDLKRMKLLDSRLLNNGVAILTYQARRDK